MLTKPTDVTKLISDLMWVCGANFKNQLLKCLDTRNCDWFVEYWARRLDALYSALWSLLGLFAGLIEIGQSIYYLLRRGSWAIFGKTAGSGLGPASINAHNLTRFVTSFWNTLISTFLDLPFYRYRDEIAKIIDYEQKNWNSSWDKRFRDHPEAMFPDYNILVNSKPYLMHNATQISRFETEFYVWVDAGYSKFLWLYKDLYVFLGHGSKEIIPHGLWDPELSSGKITVIKVTPEVDKPER